MLTECIFAKTLLSFMIALWISLSLMELLAMTMLQISCSCWWLNTAALPPARGCSAVTECTNRLAFTFTILLFIKIIKYIYIRNSCSTFTHPSAHTQQWTHTHHEHTPGAVGSHLCHGARGAVVGSVPCSRAPRRGIEDGESTVHSLPPPTIPNGLRLEFATFRLWVRLSTIRPQLPPFTFCKTKR